MTITPRIAESIDDLRVGMVVAFFHLLTVPRWVVGTIDGMRTGINQENVRLTGTGALTFEQAFQWVILSEPPPSPVSVSREAFDALAEAVGQAGVWSGNSIGLANAALALVEEARRAEG